MRKMTMLFPLAFVLLASLPLEAVKPQNVHWVILAGGSGTRLWPLSRAEKPKQFLEVTQGNLIQQSIDRLKLYPDFDQTHVYISTGSDILAQVNRLRSDGLHVDDVIVEPARRDTGPAILLSTLRILEKDPDALIMFLPADPYIPEGDYTVFSDYLKATMDYIGNEDKLLLLGKKPEFAATGYGYIEFNAKAGTVHGIQSISRFHEKPKLEVAESYLQRSNFLWNMGIFAGKAKVFAQLFAKYAPQIYQPMVDYVAGKGSYEAAQKKSVDFAVMEPSSLNGELAVLPVDNFRWHDVGNVDVFLSIRGQYLQEQGEAPLVYELEASGNKVKTDTAGKMVAIVGVDGLCVVDEKDVLLITKCTEAERLKQVVDDLKKNKQFEKFL